MKRNIIVILFAMVIMFLIAEDYASADPKAPKKKPASNQPIQNIICTEGSAADQVECLKSAINEVANSIDFIYKFNLNNTVPEELRPLYEKALTDTTIGIKSQLDFMAKNTPPGSYGELTFLRYKYYLLLKMSMQFNYMGAGPEQKVELN